MHAVAERKFHSARIHGPESSSVDLNLQEETGHMVKRSRFDSYLLEKAREAGADVFEGTETVACEQLRRGIRVLCKGDSFKSRLLAGADGFDSIVAKSLRMRGCWQPDEVAVGITANVPMKELQIEEASYKDVDEQTGLHFYFGAIEWGYGWFFPKHDEVSIGLGCQSDKANNLTEKWERFVGQPERSKRMKVDVSNRRGFRLPFYARSTKLAARRAMLLGDAAGLASPISGEGIYYAIRSGAIAAQVAKETVEMKRISHVNSYERRIREEIGRELEVHKFIAKTLFESNDTVERILRLLSKDEVLQRYAKQIISGEIKILQNSKRSEHKSV
ncbi:MAG: FAD-dependent monooxygenase [Promethearchaeia archaeon]